MAYYVVEIYHCDLTDDNVKGWQEKNDDEFLLHIDANLDEDDFSLEMIEAGAEDIELEDDRFVITAAKEDFGMIQSKLEELEITPEEASLERIPITLKQIDEETFEQNMKLIEALESDDDVIRVFHNIDTE